MFTAAAAVDYASRPILLFYGLSQAGRAVAAASTAADNDGYRLSGHGIEAVNLSQRPPLHLIKLVDKGSGSYTRLASLLACGSLPKGAPFGQIWATIPDLRDSPLDTGSTLSGCEEIQIHAEAMAHSSDGKHGVEQIRDPDPTASGRSSESAAER